MADKNPPHTQDNSPAVSSPPHPSSSDNNVNDHFDRSNSLKAIGASNSKDVDQFIRDLWAIEDKASGLPDVPDIINFFSRDMESRVQMYVSGNVSRRFGKCDEEDSDFMDSVRRMSKLITAVCEFQNVDSLLNQTTTVLHRAAVLLEDEFRALLDDSRNNPEPPPPPPPLETTPSFYKFSSFNSKTTPPDHLADRSVLYREADSGEYPGYSPVMAAKLGEIAGTMIAAGYEVECSQVYFLSRRNAIRNHVTKLEYDVVSMDDVAKMTWQSLELEIARWIGVVKNFTDVIFPGERKLGESVFAESPETHQRVLSRLVRIVLIQLLEFADATALAKLSAEKLFKYLDMYETLKTLILSIRDDKSCTEDLIADVSDAEERIGESVVGIFCYLEESIRSDAARTPVPGGAVHPLTRYVMNYLKYACAYKNTLEEIFDKHTDLTFPIPANPSTQELEKETESPHNFETATATSPFSIQLVTMMDLLDSNLAKKSDLYKDPALHYIFLMNNGRYILQKVKGSPEIKQVMGDNWCRRRSTVVRKYHKNYQRETWNKVVQCLNHEGIVGNGGKVNKAVLKERVKAFTAMFEEIQRTQSGWAVSDEQLQSELRISISGVVIPAYRSFVGRFRQHLEPGGRHAGKYIKYQPEDIEGLIEGLFEGNMNASMGRRR